MNWRRGLLRAWIVFSVLWVVGTAIGRDAIWNAELLFNHGSYMAERSGCIEREEAAKSDFACRDRDGIYFNAGDNLLSWLGIALAVPLMVFLLAYVLLWIGRGFKSAN